MRLPICSISGGALLALCVTGCSNDLTMRMRIEEPIRVEGPMMIFEGHYISGQLFERIKVNETTREWVIVLLGEPTECHTLDDGTEVWKWFYREQGFNTSVLTLLGGEEEGAPSLPQMLTFVRLRDGVVIEKWRG